MDSASNITVIPVYVVTDSVRQMQLRGGQEGDSAESSLRGEGRRREKVEVEEDDELRY